MNYNVTYKCGHSKFIDMPRKAAEREQIYKDLKNSLCPMCRDNLINEENARGCREFEVTHDEHTNLYQDCKIKLNSYDSHKNTIVIYVRKDVE